MGLKDKMQELFGGLVEKPAKLDHIFHIKTKNKKGELVSRRVEHNAHGRISCKDYEGLPEELKEHTKSCDWSGRIGQNACGCMGNMR